MRICVLDDDLSQTEFVAQTLTAAGHLCEVFTDGKSLIHELRRRGGGIGVGTLCAGGGMGSATVLEVHPPA